MLAALFTGSDIFLMMNQIIYDPITEEPIPGKEPEELMVPMSSIRRFSRNLANPEQTWVKFRMKFYYTHLVDHSLEEILRAASAVSPHSSENL